MTGYQLNTRKTGFGGNPEINTTALANQIGKNYQTDNAGAAAARVWQWNIMATIRLKDIADFFDKVPLIEGAFMRFTINYTTAASVASGPTMVTTSITQRTGRTNPLLLTSSAANNPLNGTVANGGGGVFSVSCGVVSTTSPASFTNALLPYCRLYVPAYIMNPTYESQLISISPRREIVYTDIYNFNITNIGAGASFNSILINGIVNPKYLVAMPYLTGTAADTGLAIAANTYQSVFDTAPATTAPLAASTQFQVRIGGQNAFQQNFQYDFETFINETSSINAANGVLSTGVVNGLIGHYEWENAYRYYCRDISRRLPSEDSVPKSVVVQGINNTSKSMDYVCFIIYKRRIVVDMLTGALCE